MVIPTVVIQESNKIASPNAWLWLLTVTLPDTSIVRLVKNNENITFDGNVYTKFNFNVQAGAETSKAAIPVWSIVFSNQSRIMGAFAEQQNGAVGSTVLIQRVNSGHLAESFVDLEFEFSVTSSSVIGQNVTYNLGVPDLLGNRFPQWRYTARHCRFQFELDECAYPDKRANPSDDIFTGSATDCGRTFSECTDRGNTNRFGGHKGLAGGSARIA